MKIKTLQLSGFIGVYANDVFLEKELPDDYEKYYYTRGESIGAIVTDHFAKIVKPFKVSLEDWRRGELVHYKDVFVQYYVSNKKITWEEANESHIKKLAGDMNVEEKLDGYSEYTITNNWVDMFIGGHNLREELKRYEKQYVIIKINYKINKETK